MKKTLLKTMLLLCALIVGGSAWAQGVSLVYTLSPTTNSATASSAYDQSYEFDINSVSWNVTGNSSMNPWRIGGKAQNNSTPLTVERTIYSQTAIADNVTKIEVTHGSASSVTVNSWTLIVSKYSDFSNPVSTITPSFSASSTTTITSSL